jgi:hypothetical protein
VFAVVAAIGASTSALASVPTAASGRATKTVTITVQVRYVQSATTWKGTFVTTTSSGQVIDRGSALDQPRISNRAAWRIQRKLVSKKGTLLFAIHGPYHKPTATLTWTIAAGTGAYAGLIGTGEEVEHIGTSTATARMSGVPTP